MVFVIPLELYINKDYTKARRRVLLLIAKTCNTLDDKTIIDVEMSCYTYAKQKENFTISYNVITNKVTQNLNFILEKKVKPELMAFADFIDNSLQEKLKLRINQKIKTKINTMYKCRNCNKKEVVVKQIQTRSLDEGFNSSITCQFCGYHWITRG